MSVKTISDKAYKKLRAEHWSVVDGLDGNYFQIKHELNKFEIKFDTPEEAWVYIENNYSKSNQVNKAKARIKNTIMIDGKRKVCRIYDAGSSDNSPVDRYTIAFKGYRAEGYGMVYPYLASSDHPFHPQGFGQHGESKFFLTGKHLGKRVDFEAMPADVKKFILQSI